MVGIHLNLVLFATEPRKDNLPFFYYRPKPLAGSKFEDRFAKNVMKRRKNGNDRVLKIFYRTNIEKKSLILSTRTQRNRRFGRIVGQNGVDSPNKTSSPSVFAIVFAVRRRLSLSVSFYFKRQFRSNIPKGRLCLKIGAAVVLLGDRYKITIKGAGFFIEQIGTINGDSSEMEKITEQASRYNFLEKMSVREILEGINREDQTVATAVARTIPEIERFVEQAVERMKQGGRLFYIGAGTSGRLGILDASEIPPTFGAPYDLVVGLMAGGDSAIRKAVEGAEDDVEGGWRDLEKFQIGSLDSLVGIAASGTTPYVVGALDVARKNGVWTACVTCNPDSPVTKVADVPIVAVVGPEFVTGSTRMKSGTAQKMILNMISSACMIRLGRVKGNKMVDMRLANVKLVDRGTRMIVEETRLDYETAKELLLKSGSVRAALESRQ